MNIIKIINISCGLMERDLRYDQKYYTVLKSHTFFNCKIDIL
jgi:hypothetical protein